MGMNNITTTTDDLNLGFVVDTSELNAANETVKEMVELLSSIINDIKINITIEKNVGIFDIAKEISDNIPLISIGAGIILTILKAMPGKIGDIFSKLGDTLNKKFVDIGKNLAKGLIQGIRENMSDVQSAVKEYLAEPPKKIIMSENEIASPSKLFKRLGGYMSEGLGIGISDSSKEAIKAAENMCDKVVNSTDGLKDASKAGKTYEKAMEGVANSSKGLAKAVEGSTDGLGDGFDDAKKSAKKFGETAEEAGDQAEKAGSKKISFGGAFAIAVTIIGALVEFFKNLMESNEEFGAKVDEVWGKVTEAFAPVTEAVMGIFDAFTQGTEGLGESSEGFGGFMSFISETVGTVATFISGLIEGISVFFSEHGDKIMGVVTTAWGFIQQLFGAIFAFVSEIWAACGDDIMAGIEYVWGFLSTILGGAINVVTGILDIVVGIFTGNGEKIKEGFGKVWEGIKEIFSGIGAFFGGIWDSIVSVFKKVGTKIGNAVAGAFKSVVNSVLGFVEGIVNGVIKGINSAISLINKIPGVSISAIATVKFKRMAQGGFAEPGQFFLAREAGPELVGTIGSKTAVMNNNQIVDAVSNGVYRAVTAAMGGGGGKYTFNITNAQVTCAKKYQLYPLANPF